MKFKLFFTVLAIGLVGQACSAKARDGEGVAESGSRFERILAGEHRSDANRSRDRYRHPEKTLEFFGLSENTHVVEIWPAGGWYTEVIAPYVNEKGKYYAAHWDPESNVEFIRRGARAYQDKLAAYPNLYGTAEMTVLMPPDHLEIASPESVDLVVTFRNIHNWMPRGSADDIFSAIYRALKPGGVLGVVEHRGNSAVPQDPKAASGYVNQWLSKPASCWRLPPKSMPTRTTPRITKPVFGLCHQRYGCKKKTRICIRPSAKVTDSHCGSLNQPHS